jgi:hypothetical protein
MKQKISFLLLSVLLIIAFNSCKKDSNVTGPSPGQSLLINSQISGWDLGNNYMLRFAIYGNDYSYHIYLDSSIISSSGAFSIYPKPLPGYVAFPSLAWNKYASGSLTVSDTNVQLSNQAQFIVYSDSLNKNVGIIERMNFTPDSGKDNIGWFITYFYYATGNLNVGGYYLLDGKYDTVFCDLHYTKGWNTVTEKLLFNNNYRVNFELSTYEPSGAKWIYKSGYIWQKK